MTTLYQECKWLSAQPMKEAERTEMCQCGTERVISRAADSGRMRAVLLTYVFLDQFIFTHFCHSHQQFKSQFIGPKLRQHSFGGHASPSWFIYSIHGYDKRADWEALESRFSDGLKDCLLWLSRITHVDELQFWELIKQEITNEFEPQHLTRFLYKVPASDI